MRMEIAVLGTNIDVRVERITNPGNQLPGKSALFGVIVEFGVTAIKLDLAPGEAGAGTGIEAEPVLITEIQQQVRHDRGVACVPVGIESAVAHFAGIAKVIFVVGSPLV